MRYGTTISLDQDDIDKLTYIGESCNFHSPTSGMTGLIRLCIRKAYAHQIMCDEQKKEILNKKVDDIEGSIKNGGISQEPEKSEKKIPIISNLWGKSKL